MKQEITVTVEAELADEAKGLSPILHFAETYVITDQGSYERAIEHIRVAKKHRGEFDRKRKDITEPLLLSKRRVDELFRPVIATLDGIENAFRIKCSEYLRDQARARETAAEAAALALRSIPAEPIVLDGVLNGEHVQVTIPPPVVARDTHTIEYWTVEVKDATAVPREFCSPDYDKLQAVAGTREVPGVTFERRERVVVR
jgi:hypothetical protein